MVRTMVIGAAIVILSLSAGAALADSGHTAGPAGSRHRVVTGTVTEDRSGVLSVKTKEGTTMTLAPAASRRHGHGVPKVGEEVTMVLNENNQIIDVHPKGQEGQHRFVTGELVHVGRMKPEIKLRTEEGERTFPLSRQEIKTGPFEDGALVTAEVNEAGSVIDLHRAAE